MVKLGHGVVTECDVSMPGQWKAMAGASQSSLNAKNKFISYMMRPSNATAAGASGGGGDGGGPSSSGADLQHVTPEALREQLIRKHGDLSAYMLDLMVDAKQREMDARVKEQNRKLQKVIDARRRRRVDRELQKFTLPKIVSSADGHEVNILSAQARAHIATNHPEVDARINAVVHRALVEESARTHKKVVEVAEAKRRHIMATIQEKQGHQATVLERMNAEKAAERKQASRTNAASIQTVLVRHADTTTQAAQEKERSLEREEAKIAKAEAARALEVETKRSHIAQMNDERITTAHARAQKVQREREASRLEEIRRGQQRVEASLRRRRKSQAADQQKHVVFSARQAERREAAAATVERMAVERYERVVTDLPNIDAIVARKEDALASRAKTARVANSHAMQSVTERYVGILGETAERKLRKAERLQASLGATANAREEHMSAVALHATHFSTPRGTRYEPSGCHKDHSHGATPPSGRGASPAAGATASPISPRAQDHNRAVEEHCYTTLQLKEAEEEALAKELEGRLAERDEGERRRQQTVAKKVHQRAVSSRMHEDEVLARSRDVAAERHEHFVAHERAVMAKVNSPRPEWTSPKPKHMQYESGSFTLPLALHRLEKGTDEVCSRGVSPSQVLTPRPPTTVQHLTPTMPPSPRPTRITPRQPLTAAEQQALHEQSVQARQELLNKRMQLVAHADKNRTDRMRVKQSRSIKASHARQAEVLQRKEELDMKRLHHSEAKVGATVARTEHHNVVREHIHGQASELRAAKFADSLQRVRAKQREHDGARTAAATEASPMKLVSP